MSTKKKEPKEAAEGVLVIDPASLPGGASYQPTPRDPVRAFQVGEPFRVVGPDGELSDVNDAGRWVTSDGATVDPEAFPLNYQPTDV